MFRPDTIREFIAYNTRPASADKPCMSSSVPEVLTIYFDFDLGGQTHVKSTRLKSERQVLDYAAPDRLKLIKQQVGIVEEEEPHVSTFLEFQAQFDVWIAKAARRPDSIAGSDAISLVRFGTARKEQTPAQIFQLRTWRVLNEEQETHS